MDLQETIVLRIKREREEAIQLLTMDPQVYNELLTHHRRGTNEDDEPLRDGVQIGSGVSGTCGGWKLIFVDSPRVSGILWYLQSKEAVREATEVGTTCLGAPAGPDVP